MESSDEDFNPKASTSKKSRLIESEESESETDSEMEEDVEDEELASETETESDEGEEDEEYQEDEDAEEGSESESEVDDGEEIVGKKKKSGARKAISSDSEEGSDEARADAKAQEMKDLSSGTEDDGDSVNCAICLGKLTAQKLPSRPDSGCEHYFCKECLTEWAKQVRRVYNSFSEAKIKTRDIFR